MRFLLLCFITCIATTAERIPPPIDVPMQDAFLVIVIPDLAATIDRIDGLVARVAPGRMEPGALKRQIGLQINDPDLLTLSAQPIAVAMAPSAPWPSVAIVLPSTNVELTRDAFAMLNNQVEVQGELVIIGRRAGDLPLGRRLAAIHPRLTAEPIIGDARIRVDLTTFARAYEPLLTGMMTMATARLEGPRPHFAKLLRLQAAAMLAAMSDVGIMQVDVAISDTDLSIDTVIAPAHQELGSALQVPTAAGVADRLGSAAGSLRVSGRYPPALMRYLHTLVARVAARPEHAGSIASEVLTAIASSTVAFDGRVAARVRTGNGRPTTDYALGIADAASALDLINGTGARAWQAWTARMGVALAIEPDVRMAGDIAVHRWQLSPTELPDAQTEPRGAITDLEFAITDGWLIGSTVPAALDRLLTGERDAPAPAARTAVADADLIGECDLAALLQAAATDANLPARMRERLAHLPDAQPLWCGATFDGGRASVRCRLPTTLLAVLVQAMSPPPPAPIQEF